MDFNGDGFADLALRSDDSYDTEGHGVGAVQVIYGSRSGLTAQGSQYWAQDDFPGVTRSISMSGRVWACHCCRRLQRRQLLRDLAVGDFAADVGTITRAGSVRIIYGSKTGLTTARSQLLTQESTGILGGAELDCGFGRSLTASDFGHSAQADLAIGTSLEAVQVIYGSAAGLTATGNQRWSPDSPGVLGSVGGDFGASLAAGDFGESTHADLAIGAPRADVTSRRGSSSFPPAPSTSCTARRLVCRPAGTNGGHRI